MSTNICLTGYLYAYLARRGPASTPCPRDGAGAVLNLAGVVRMFDWFKSETA